MTAIEIQAVTRRPGFDASIAMGWCGPVEHGIARLARQIATAATAIGFGGPVLHEERPDGMIQLVDRLPAQTRLLHLHINDWLFADADLDVDSAIAHLVERLRWRDVALAVTLHDLPQLSDGHALYQRRCNTYRRLVASAVGVVVSSEHERLLLQEAFSAPPDGSSASLASVQVIPLPIDPFEPTGLTQPHAAPPYDRIAHTRPAAVTTPAVTEPAVTQPTVTQQTIGIFGYLYPGKGHREVIDEMTGIASGPAIVAVGRTSDRHADLLVELTDVASSRGLVFCCSGYVPDAELPGTLRRVTVPLAPHTHISASGSINSWLAAGRRPLVPAGRYVEELERRIPGSMWIYQPGDLRQSIELALAHPEMTWLPEDLVVGPSTAMVAERYLGWLRSLAVRSARNSRPGRR